MIAIVLVGGEGTRLRPLTNDTPKPMLPIVGRPMIVWIIEWLTRHDVDRVVFSLQYRADAFLTAFPDGSWSGARLDYAVEPTPLDTAGAIRFAASAAGVADEELVICNGDVLTDLDVSDLVAFHRARGARVSVAVAPVEDTSVFGVAVPDAAGRIEAFIEKPAPGTAPSNLVNIGTYVFAPGLVAAIAPERRVSVEREVFPALVDDGSLFAYASTPYWLDTGTPQRYIQAQLDILRGTNRGVVIDADNEAAPGRYCGRNVRLDGELVGVAHLGSDVVIEAGACVTDSILGPMVVVGRDATVSSSVLLAGAVVGAGATVESSVLGAGAQLGAGAVVRATSVVGNGVRVEPGALLDSARLPV